MTVIARQRVIGRASALKWNDLIHARQNKLKRATVFPVWHLSDVPPADVRCSVWSRCGWQAIRMTRMTQLGDEPCHSWSRPESIAPMIQRIAHVCFRKLGSIINSPGATLPMNTGLSECDLNRHTLSLSNTHSLTKSATIGGFDCCFDGPP
jgi:hypothetical protein